MPNQDQLEYIVKVVDQATNDINKIAKEVENLQSKFQSAAQTSEASSVSFGKLTGAFTVAQFAVMGLQSALSLAQQQFTASIEAANSYASSMIGLASVASAFGIEQEKATDAAKALAKDGLMSVSEASAGLKNLLGTGFGLDEAINLMNAFKDSAAFNRQGTLDFGQAIVGATQGIKNQNSIMVDNVGITKNLSIILEEAGYSMQDLSRVTTDASVRQALYNGLLAEGAIFAGDAERSASTLAGTQSTLETSIYNLQAAIGQTLSPAVQMLLQQFNEWINDSEGRLKPMMADIAKGTAFIAGVFIQLAETVRAAARVIISAVESIGIAIQNLKKGNVMGAITETWKNTFDDLTKIGSDYIGSFEKTAEKIGAVWNKIDKQGVGKMPTVTRDALNRTGAAIDKGAGQIAKKLEQLADRIADINRNIERESKNFAKRIGDATADFERQIRDLVIRHRDAIRDLRQEIKDLQGDFDEGAKERLDSHTDKVDKIKKKYEEETKNLKDNLKRRLADSTNSDEQIIKFFEKQIAEKESKRDEEIKEEEETYKKQEAKEKAQFEKRLNELQTKLNTELEIQKKHQDDFNKFKDAVYEDDITRAKSQFEREMALMRYQHDERMVELKRQLEEVQAMKNEIMGTNTKSNLNYTRKAPVFNQETTRPKTSSYSNQSSKPKTQPKTDPLAKYKIPGLTINQNIYNNTDYNAALNKIGWFLK